MLCCYVPARFAVGCDVCARSAVVCLGVITLCPYLSPLILVPTDLLFCTISPFRFGFLGLESPPVDSAS